MLALCTNPKEFLNKFNPDFCTDRYEHLNTIETALTSGMIKISDIQFAYNKETAIDLIRAWLMNLSIYSGLDSDENVIKDIAIHLYSEISMFNLAEFTLFFSKLKKGYYGSLYGRFDGLMICNSARGYMQQRGLVLSRLSEEDQLKI